MINEYFGISKFCWISPMPVTGYIAKKGSHFEKKVKKL
jgi:hypothetical protein